MFGNKLGYSVLFLGAAFQAVYATTVTAPQAGDRWESGTQQEIRWSDPSENTVEVRLVKGKPENLQFVQLLCPDVAGSAGKCTTTVPRVASGIDYAVTVGKDPAKYGYSSYFDIKGDGEMPPRTGCPKMGGQNCPQSLPCCSSSGYCGDSDAHCGQGCMPQYSFNGVCTKPGSSTSNPQPPTSNPQPPTSNPQPPTSNPQPPTSNPQPPTSNPQPPTNNNPGPLPPVTPVRRKCGNSVCGQTKPCCNKLTNKCSNTIAGCYYCIARRSFQGKCKRYHSKFQF